MSADDEGVGTFDEPALEALVELTGSPRAMGDLVRAFSASAAQLRAAIAGGDQTGDAKAAQRAAHSLKSSSAMFGARDLAEICEKLEDHAATAPTSPPLFRQADVAALDAALARALACLARRFPAV